MFSTNDSFAQGMIFRSKSPLIDQTITSTIGGGITSFNSLSDNPERPKSGLQSLAEEYRQK
jgi:hypothetical protein